MTRLTLLVQAATAVTRAGGFPAPDDPVDPRERTRLERRSWPTAARLLSAPDRAARETAAWIGDAAPVAALRDADHGRWAGRRFAEVADTPAFAAWIVAPWRAAPGGEEFAIVRARVGAWMDDLAEDVLAVVGPMVVRAAIAHALDLTAAAAMRIDVAPLATVTLSRTRDWRLQGLGTG